MFSLQAVFIGISVALPVLATAAVALRFHARRAKQLAYGADDWTILATLVSTLPPAATRPCPPVRAV